jgi:hypothetical protein
MPIGSSKLGVLGAGLVPGGTETFNAPGTFSIPPGVKKVSITGVGGTGNPGTQERREILGGGGGGGRGNAGNAGGCGGAGGCGVAGTPATFNCVPVTPGCTAPITVGSPGGQIVISWNPQ